MARVTSEKMFKKRQPEKPGEPGRGFESLPLSQTATGPLEEKKRGLVKDRN